MEFIKVKIHPLFFLVGVFSIIVGELAPFIICTLTALLHECGHIFYAEKIGYNCKNVKLMPYGAAAVCDIEGISAKDEVLLALSGPFINLALCVGFAGLWWFFPEAYAYTDVAFNANLAMLLLNLFPAYPLDGGRILQVAVKKIAGERVAKWVLKGTGVALALSFICLFIFAVQNPSLLILAVFLIASAFEKQQPACKIKFVSQKKLRRGVEVKYIKCNQDITFRHALTHLDSAKYLVLQIYFNDFLEEISEEELIAKLQTASVYDRVLSSEEN
ncbi:MAG: hypothetical protein E7370_03145 [Clostridiales bacterium]|nr:hypothetical protein [Clostridiales bacterium]